MPENQSPAPDAVAVEKKRVADLKAAFPNDAAFAIDQAAAGASVLEAKAAYADKLALENKALREKVTASEASATLPGNKGLGGHAAGKRDETEATDSSDAVALFDELVTNQVKANGGDRGAALRTVVAKNPQAHKAYLLATNDRKAHALINEKFSE